MIKRSNALILATIAMLGSNPAIAGVLNFDHIEKYHANLYKESA